MVQHASVGFNST